MRIDLSEVKLPVTLRKAVVESAGAQTGRGDPTRNKLRYALLLNEQQVAEFDSEKDYETAEAAIMGALSAGDDYAEFEATNDVYPSYVKRKPTIWKPTMQQKAMLPLVDQIKAFENMPLMYKKPVESLLMRKDDLYMQREPLCKFGTYCTGIGDYWMWYSDNHIMQSATPADCAKMLAEMAEAYAKLIEETFKEEE